MLLIGIAGPARSGKDTVADMIMKSLDTSVWKHDTFAAPMKAMLAVIGVDCSGDTDREAVLADYGVSTRHMMQSLGTEWGRHQIGPDVWVDVFARINKRERCIVSDVRFANEAALVRANGILVHVVGRGGIEGSHISESGVEIGEFDIVLDNSGSLDDLQAQLDMWDIPALVFEEKKRRKVCGSLPGVYSASVRSTGWTYSTGMEVSASSHAEDTALVADELKELSARLAAWDMLTAEEEREIINRILELRGMVR